MSNTRKSATFTREGLLTFTAPYRLSELRKSRSMLFGLGVPNMKISIRRSGYRKMNDNEDSGDNVSLVSL